MTTREELERLSSKELHDRAVALAKRRLDISFLWDLMKTIPAADVAAGKLDRSEVDIMKFTPLLNDLRDADEGALAEALRPFYVDYLEKHGGGETPANEEEPDPGQ